MAGKQAVRMKSSMNQLWMNERRLTDWPVEYSEEQEIKREKMNEWSVSFHLFLQPEMIFSRWAFEPIICR